MQIFHDVPLLLSASMTPTSQWEGHFSTCELQDNYRF